MSIYLDVSRAPQVQLPICSLDRFQQTIILSFQLVQFRSLILQLKIELKMNNLKSSASRKYSYRLPTSQTEKSLKTPELLKMNSYPSGKSDPKASTQLVRKLINQVKSLQKQNQILKNKVHRLEEENKSLNFKWDEIQSCKLLIEETKTFLNSIEETKPRRRLSQSFACYSEIDRSSLGILGKIQEIDEFTRIESIQPSFKTDFPLSWDGFSKNKSLDQELKNRIIKYNQKINDLLTSNFLLSEKMRIYKVKYSQLKEDLNNALRLLQKRG